MNAKLIYFYLISFVACLAAACSENAPDIDKVGNGYELAFDVADLSRADAMTNISFSDSKFAVYGDMKFMENYAHTIIFDKTIVTYRNGKWGYSDTQYWFPRHEHSFVAVYPVDAAGMSDTKYSDSELSFTYTLPDNFESANDLMVATHRRKMPEDNPSYSALPVKFGFFHILSRVNFQVKNDKAADILKVTQIKLKGINRTGTFSIAPASLLSGCEQTDDYDSSWTGISNKDTFTANILVNIRETETGSLFPDDNALFMIPQPDNKDIIMEITYEQWDDGEMFEEHTLTAVTPIGGWEWGKMYTYTINIEEITREIYVTVSVKDWQSKGPSDITVPEI